MLSLHLTHYRNYHEAMLELGRHTVFIGPNGSGKTNIIEALRTLSVTKSYRVTRDSDAIEWDTSYCSIIFHDESLQDKIEYILVRDESSTKKVMKHNGIVIPLTQVYGLLPTVLFSPETIRLIDGPPQERRRFLDAILSQAEPDYIESLLNYRKVIRERHYLLLRLQQRLGNMDELAFWDNELVSSGSVIITHRQKFIHKINELLQTIYPQFIEDKNKETLTLAYKPSVVAEFFAARLKQNQRYDIKTAATSVGPHRDELAFLLADRDVTLFASRGEMRRSILAIKLAEAHSLADMTNKEPVLLLDDVFSEFDSLRRTKLLDAIKDYRSVITTTDANFLKTHPLPDAILTHLPLKEPTV